MPTPIPTTIHYVWLGKRFRSARVNTLLQWAKTNPTHQHYLWVRRTNLYVFADEILSCLQYTQSEDGALKERSDGVIEIEVSDVLYVLYTIELRAVEDLPPLTSIEALYNEFYAWSGMPALEEIVGVWALYEYGGIYVDFATHPVNALPLEIIAPKELLLAELPDIGHSLATAVVVGARHCQKLRQLCTVLAVHTQEGHELAPAMLQKTNSFSEWGILSYDMFSPTSHIPERLRGIEESPTPSRRSRFRPPALLGRLFKRKGRRPPSPPASSASSSTNSSPFEDSMEVVSFFESEEALSPPDAEPTSIELTQKWFAEVETNTDLTALKVDYSFQQQTGVRLLVDESDKRYNTVGVFEEEG